MASEDEHPAQLGGENSGQASTGSRTRWLRCCEESSVTAQQLGEGSSFGLGGLGGPPD